MAVDSPHLVLDSQRIVETISRLQGRIESRFPGAGLSRICGELLLTARAAARLAEDFARPIMPLRVLIVFFVGTLAVGIGAAIAAVRTPWRHLTVDDIVQTSEAGLSEAVLVGAGLLFLIGWERRLKRSRALRAIHRLRSLAHIIDMHQLTKDPERLLNRYSLTEFSPHEAMSAFQLSRYLDYCAELLSLTGKVAAIYIQRFDDPVVLDAVGDVEDLTNGLCQKIAQKNKSSPQCKRRPAIVTRARDDVLPVMPAGSGLIQRSGAGTKRGSTITHFFQTRLHEANNIDAPHNPRTMPRRRMSRGLLLVIKSQQDTSPFPFHLQHTTFGSSSCV